MRCRTLPSGTFVELRRVTWLDVVVARRASTGSPDLYSAILLSRVGTFDGEKREAEGLMEMDYADVVVTLELLQEMMNGPVLAKDLVQKMVAVVLGKAKEKQAGTK